MSDRAGGGRRIAVAVAAGLLSALAACVAVAVPAAAATPPPSSDAADVGFPWGWTMVAAVTAAGIAATVTALRRTRSLDGGDSDTVVAARAAALIDGSRAALARDAATGVASWRALDDDAGDLLTALHIAADSAGEGKRSPAYADAIRAVAAVSAALAAAAEAAAEPGGLPPVLEELGACLDDAERALEPLKAMR